jgi:hypothetical protein
LIPKDKVITELVKNFENEYFRSFQTLTTMPARKRVKGNVFFNSHLLIKIFSDNLDPFVLVALEQQMNEIKDWLEEEAFGHFFGNLYLVERSRYFNNRPQLQNRLEWSINDIHTAHIMMLKGSALVSSLGSTFFERLKELVNADCKIIDGRDPQFLKLAIINLCNVIDCLLFYISMPEAEKMQKDLAKEYMESSLPVLEKAFLDKVFLDEHNLGFFMYLSIKRCKEAIGQTLDGKQIMTYNELEKDFEAKIEQLKSYNVILSLCNIYYLNREKFFTLFEKSVDKLIIDWNNRPFYVRILSFYLENFKSATDEIPLKISPSFSPENVDDVLNKLFPEYYQSKKDITTEDKDMEKMNAFHDQEIRSSLADIFQRSQYITNEEKERLIEECKKPHNVNEISDFEIKMGNYPFIYACMPIKSGQEIKKGTVPENYAYQILKPFIHLFDSCVVIFITVKPCSAALDAYIKKWNSVFHFPIAVLQDELLCKIFKYYGKV